MEEGQAHVEKKSSILTSKLGDSWLAAPTRHFHGAARDAEPQQSHLIHDRAYTLSCLSLRASCGPHGTKTMRYRIFHDWPGQAKTYQSRVFPETRSWNPCPMPFKHPKIARLAKLPFYGLASRIAMARAGLGIWGRGYPADDESCFEI